MGEDDDYLLTEFNEETEEEEYPLPMGDDEGLVEGEDILDDALLDGLEEEKGGGIDEDVLDDEILEELEEEELEAEEEEHYEELAKEKDGEEEIEAEEEEYEEYYELARENN